MSINAPLNKTDSLNLVTAEGVPFSIPLAGPTRRFLAWLIDILISSACAGALASLSGLLITINPDWGVAVQMLSFFLLKFCYAILLEWYWRGQTLGKFLFRIRVMDVQGLKLQFSQVVLRNLMRVIDAMPVLYFVGGSAMLLSPLSQRLGDLAANTVVVRTRSVRLPNLDEIAPPKYNSFRNYPHLEARLRQQVLPEEAALLVDALLRRESLEAEARVSLYTDLADHFKEKATFPKETVYGLTDEQYLRNVLESLFRN